LSKELFSTPTVTFILCHPTLSELVEATNGAFERALVFLHKMPRIWLMWLEFFAPQVHGDSCHQIMAEYGQWSFSL
jgi:hypothetical protein